MAAVCWRKRDRTICSILLLCLFHTSIFLAPHISPGTSNNFPSSLLLFILFDEEAFLFLFLFPSEPKVVVCGHCREEACCWTSLKQCLALVVATMRIEAVVMVPATLKQLPIETLLAEIKLLSHPVSRNQSHARATNHRDGLVRRSVAKSKCCVVTFSVDLISSTC